MLTVICFQVLRPAPIAEEEEIEQDDIDEQGYHFANNDNAPFEEDEIDAEVDAPEVSISRAYSFARSSSRDSATKAVAFLLD